MTPADPHLALITGHPGPIGGMEKFARFLVHTALAGGCRVTVALSGENIFASVGAHNREKKADRMSASPALTVECVDWIDSVFKGDREYRLSHILARRRWFRRVRPDVAVFVQSSNTPFRASVVGAALAGVPVVLTHRTMPYVIPPVASRRHVFGLLPGLGLYRRKMIAKTRLVGELAARIVYNSEDVRREYERDYCYPARKGRVIPNAVTVPTLSDEPASIKRPLTIGYVGRLAGEKRLDVLLRSVAALRNGRPICLALWGDGPERAALAALAGELGIAERVAWHGKTEDTAAAYLQCDIVALCSPRESSSNMVLEAMAAGRAVVVTTAGGQPELVEGGRCGLIVPPGDPVALAGALGRLIGNDSERIALGERARESARARHNPRAIGRAWLEMLEEAMSARCSEADLVSLDVPGM
jgi:glycosyltransferase involved in cell wall biosynthesis